MESKDGRSYLNMILSDSTGDLEVKKWQGAELIVDKISRGNYVEVQGKVNSYQNRIQLIASEINLVSAEGLNRADFVAASSNSSDKMFDELIKIVETLDDVYIKDLCNAILFDPEISRRLRVWAAGKSIHHCYEGGLLEHTLSCAKLAFSLSAHFNVNKNYVIAGAILHDISKVYELTDGDLVDYTEEGKLLGHLVKSLELLDRYVGRIVNFPHTMKIHLKHILSSHHGEYQFGSPKIPQTSEALLVHHIDLLDSKMNSFVMAKKQDNSSGHWTGFVKHLDRTIYKAELPFFKDYLNSSDDIAVEQSLLLEKEISSDKKRGKSLDKELKYSMGNQLKDFKINDDD